MRKQRYVLLIGLIGLLILGTIAVDPVSAAVVWEDNFDDGTYAPEWSVVNGTWSASSYELEALAYIDAITRESTFTRGSRVFDFTTGIDTGFPWIVNIYPIASDLVYWGDMSSCYGPSYGVGIQCGDYYLDLVESINNVTTILDSYEYVSGFDGSYNINFTLGSNRYVTVLLDGELVLEATASSAAIPYAPEYFYINAVQASTLDNFVICDTNEETTTTTTTTPSTTTPTESTTPPPATGDMTTMLIIAGGGIAVVVVIVIIVKMRGS